MKKNSKYFTTQTTNKKNQNCCFLIIDHVCTKIHNNNDTQCQPLHCAKRIRIVRKPPFKGGISYTEQVHHIGRHHRVNAPVCVGP